MTSFYLNVFRESAFVSSIIPFVGEPTFFAIIEFSKYGYDYNKPLAVVIATLGAAVGASFSFLLGKWCLKLYRSRNVKEQISAEKYSNVAKSFSRYFTILFPFTWLPLLNLLPFTAGFLSLRAWRVLPLVIIGKAAYYGYYLW